MQCEMCGKDAELANIKIEGTTLLVCPDCARFGQIVKMPEKQSTIIKKKPSFIQEVESNLYIVDDFAQIIRHKREELGLKQNEFALRVQEKESVIQAIENNKMTPSIILAGKLEKMLGIKLIEKEVKQEIIRDKSGNGSGLTLGDFIKKR